MKRRIHAPLGLHAHQQTRLLGHARLLTTACTTHRYNAEVSPENRIEASPSQLAVLIASTRALWEAFLAACRRDERLMQSEHPLDTFVEQRVRAAAAALGCALPVA